MCDYSLHAVRSEDARREDVLISTGFNSGWTPTRGFRREGGDPDTAICLLPGTEVAFEEVILARTPFTNGTGAVHNTGYRTAVFAKKNEEHHSMHHDALEFPDGRFVMVTNLVLGQKCTVLQLPAPKPVAKSLLQAMRTLEDITAV